MGSTSIETLELESQKIELKDLCEFLTICPDYQEFIGLRKKDLVDKNDQKRYSDLADQIQNLCSNKTSLQDSTLICQPRNKYLTVNLGSNNGKEMHIDKLPDGYYFLRKKSHKMVSSVRHHKSQLLGEIIERYKKGWQPGEIVVENANLPFMNIYTPRFAKHSGAKNGT